MLAELGRSPLIAVLEDRGVHKEAFLDLQNAAKSAVATATDSMEKTVELLRKHDLGNVFGLRGILQHLADAGMGMRDRKSTRLNSSHSGESRMPSSA